MRKNFPGICPVAFQWPARLDAHEPLVPPEEVARCIFESISDINWPKESKYHQQVGWKGCVVNAGGASQKEVQALCSQDHYPCRLQFMSWSEPPKIPRVLNLRGAFTTKLSTATATGFAQFYEGARKHRGSPPIFLAPDLSKQQQQQDAPHRRLRVEMRMRVNEARCYNSCKRLQSEMKSRAIDHGLVEDFVMVGLLGLYQFECRKHNRQ